MQTFETHKQMCVQVLNPASFLFVCFKKPSKTMYFCNVYICMYIMYIFTQVISAEYLNIFKLDFKC